MNANKYRCSNADKCDNKSCVSNKVHAHSVCCDDPIMLCEMSGKIVKCLAVEVKE